MSKDFLVEILSRIGLHRPVARTYRRVSARARQRERDIRLEAERKIPRGTREPRLAFEKYVPSKRALLVGQATVDVALLQLPLIAGLRVSGFEVRVLLHAPSRAMEGVYRMLGVAGFVYLEDVLRLHQHPRAREALSSCGTVEQLLAFNWAGASSGKFAAATYMRHTRRGDIDLLDPATSDHLLQYLSRSMNHAEAMQRIVTKTEPDLVCFIDRGYTPDGELFDISVGAGCSAVTMNAAHRNGSLMLKRYDSTNKDDHPVSLSSPSWETIKSMTWTDDHWRQVHDELADCYETGAWYAEVGTQVGRRYAEGKELANMLGLNPGKKTACIFPHLFWDATFFWGHDIFGNYERWFAEVLKVASKNESLNWIVKIHPANVVKSTREGHQGDHSEVVLIRDVIGELPHNMALMPADHPVSTFSLFGLIDYCVTVRGTVGLEAACFGVPVVTAGTGRYDRKGFTIDPDTEEETLNILSRLEEFEPLSVEKTNLARRYAWGTLLARPIKTTCVEFGYRHDENATLWTRVTDYPDEGLDNSEDVTSLARWLEGGDHDLLDLNPLARARASDSTSGGDDGAMTALTG